MTNGDIRNYLDENITFWREIRDGKRSGSDHFEGLKAKDKYTVACCYIDAFQSIRMNIFGETLI